MSEWQQKRFWKEAAAVAADGGFAVELDGRRLKTPAKAALVTPTLELARMIAAEWAAQGDVVDPASMPATRCANAAIDKVAVQHGEVARLLADYGGTDLLCYRAESPAALAARQAAGWDPALDWAETALGVRLRTGEGIVHVPQDTDALARLSGLVHALTPFRLAAFHDLVTLSGSLILGFAAARGWKAPEAVWELSRIDEDWQREQWGADEEADAHAETRRQAFLHAARFYTAC